MKITISCSLIGTIPFIKTISSSEASAECHRSEARSGTSRMSVWALVVCQSRNWEAFSVDLGGQGLPKALLQNNSRPGSWLWDTASLHNTHQPSPPLVLSSPSPQETGGRWKQKRQRSPRRYDLSGMRHILLRMWTDTFAWCQIQRRKDADSNLILRTGIVLLTVWHTTHTRMIHYVHTDVRRDVRRVHVNSLIVHMSTLEVIHVIREDVGTQIKDFLL